MDKNKDKVKLTTNCWIWSPAAAGLTTVPSFVWRTGKLVKYCGNDLNGAEDCEFCGRRQSWADLL